MTQFIQAGGPMVAQALKDLPVEEALAFVTQKYKEIKGV